MQAAFQSDGERSPLLWSIRDTDYFLIDLVNKNQNTKVCTLTNKTHMRSCTQTHWHRQTGPTVRPFEKQFYSLTYPLITTPPPPSEHVCFFESFISVASSTVFQRVKIEAIILPNAYLPALHAPSCTRRLLHDEVADMFHTHHPLPYVHWMRLLLMHVWYALWGWETDPHARKRKPSPIQI